ncbi:ATP-binding protein [Candidatus Enterococcus willemsii]|uniref:YhaN AAA domain-containing protein n=1 Tax=Candidatus Enterococcus willemsii TaxID=1857215 RepID=A0ABQ6Z0Z0_9ENTE|nr:AAA family ATPase [Enterococcus sp. CU12B]KAF1304584.1 hypothetical protein BAU17_10305 [Enterococcus sp. CU12B]
MRLLKAEITGFGHYRHQTFDFLPTNQLFFGKNEVGKSTLYQFIQAMLFGFPKKSTRKRDYTPQDGAAYGGKLWLMIEPYGEVQIERYRQVNRGKAKVVVGETEGDEALLTQLLAPLTQELFQDVFTFQQEQLSQTDRLQEKELHDALISLGITGSQQWMAKIQEYKKDNQKIYKRQGQRLTLNQRLKEWQQLKETIQQKELQETHVQQAYRQLTDYTQQQQNLNKQLQRVQDETQRLNQQKMNWSLYEEWAELRQLKESRFSTEQQQQLRVFYQEYQQLTDAIHKKEEELARLEQGQESDRYFFFLDQEGKIQELLRQEARVMRLVDEHQRLLQQEEMLSQDLFHLVEKWGWQQEVPPAELDEQILQLLDRLDALHEQSQQQSLRIQWLSEKNQAVEEEVNQLEKRHPELLKQSKSMTHWFLLLASGGLFMVLSFFLENPLKLFLLVLGSLLVVVGIGFVLKGQQGDAQVKPLWQEKLLQLDAYGAEIAQEEEQLVQLTRELEQLTAYLQPSFGTNDNYLTWRQTLQTYEAAIQQFHAQQAQLQTIKNQLNPLANDIQTMNQEFQVFNDWLPLENKELQVKFDLLNEFATKMQAIKMTRLQQPSTLLAQQLKKAKEERQALFTTYQELLQVFGLEHPTEIPLWMKQWEQHQKQIARKKELETLLQPIFPKEISWNELTQQLAQAQVEQERLQQQLTKLLEEKQRVQLQIEQLQVDGILDELYQEESRLLSEIHTLALSWSTNQVMIAALNDLATELSEQQLPQLLHQASYYFGLLTDGKYNHVQVVDGLLHVGSSQQLVDIYSLSTGTKDQLIMAVRFAYLSLQKETSPVIIDDGWLHYDSERKLQLAKLFAEFGKETQVICLSSDQEMVSYYQRLHQPIKEIKQRM